MDNETIYFDNAATTWPKPESVYKKTDEIFRNISGSPGRGQHSASLRAGEIVGDARKEIAAFFNIPSSNYVIFTNNGTDSLNMAIKGLINPGDKVLISPYEHNSVTRPLYRMAKENKIILKTASCLEDYSLDLDSVSKNVMDGIDYAVISHVSNVTGIVADIEKVAHIVHSAGGLLIVDAAQSAGTIEIDMKKLGIDILACPGHKGLMGPMGTGLLLLSDDFPVRPFREGGTGILSEEELQPQRLPYRLEAGTTNLPAIAGLLEGIRFIKGIGVGKIAEHESGLAAYLTDGLKKIKGITLYGAEKNPQGGMVTFTADFAEPSAIENILDQIYHIQVRSGLHCSPDAHKNIGTFPYGTVRVSLGYFNNAIQVDVFLAAIKAISKY